MCDRIVCDRCGNYEVTLSGVTEICHAQKEGSQVVAPWLSDEYRDKRLSGECKSCKGFKAIVSNYHKALTNSLKQF